MKNEVLGFVYNMLPEPEKEVMQALDLTDEDLAADITAPAAADKGDGAAQETKTADSLAAANVAASQSLSAQDSIVEDPEEIEEAEEVFTVPEIEI